MKVKTIDKVTKDYIEISTNNGEKLKLKLMKLYIIILKEKWEMVF